MSGQPLNIVLRAPGTVLTGAEEDMDKSIQVASKDELILYFDYLNRDAGAVLTITLDFSDEREAALGDDTKWYRQTEQEKAAGVATMFPKSHVWTPKVAVGQTDRFEISTPVGEEAVRVRVTEVAGTQGDLGVKAALNYVGPTV